MAAVDWNCSSVIESLSFAILRICRSLPEHGCGTYVSVWAWRGICSWWRRRGTFPSSITLWRHSLLLQAKLSICLTLQPTRNGSWVKLDCWAAFSSLLRKFSDTKQLRNWSSIGGRIHEELEFESENGFGVKVDLDLGNYERFLDVTLRRDNNITTGKIYQVNFLESLSYVPRQFGLFPAECQPYVIDLFDGAFGSK